MANIVVEMTGDEADLFRKLKTLVKEQERVEDGFDKAGKKSEESFRRGIRVTEDLKAALVENNQTLDQYARGLGRVRSAVRRSESATDRYKQDVKLLNIAKAEGRISEEQYARAVRFSTSQLKSAENQVEKTVGKGAVAKAAEFAASFATIGAAVDVVRRALEFYNGEKEKALGSGQSLVRSTQQLAQVADGDLGVLTNLSDDISKETGIERSKSRDFIFAAKSEGFLDEAKDLSELFAILQPESVAKVAGQVRSLFKGELTSKQAVNATLIGANESRASFEDISAALPIAAEGGAQQGTSAVEQIAALSVLSKDFTSSQTTAARLRALQTRLSLQGKEFGIGGKGLFEGVRLTQQLSETDRKKLLGESQEVNAAYNSVVSSFGLIETRANQVRNAIRTTGTKDSVSKQAIAGFFDESTFEGRKQKTLRDLRKSEREREIKNERQLVIKEAKNQIALNKTQSTLIDNNVGGLGRAVADTFGKGLNYFGASNSDSIQAVTTAAGNAFASPTAFLDTASALVSSRSNGEVVQRLVEINQSINRNENRNVGGKPGEDR